MSVFEALSELDRQKVEYDAGLALQSAFQAMHERTGWCGDLMPEYWEAAYPIIREAMAAVYRPAFPNGE